MTLYVCENCGEGAASYLGRCPSCKEWNTFKQFSAPSSKSTSKKQKQELVVKDFKSVKSVDTSRRKTGIYELDRVLGGGFIKGGAILLTGEPGIGKSTLLLQSLQNFSTLYISGEESAEQVKERADRLNINLDQILFSETIEVEGIIAGLERRQDRPDILVIDSVQTVYVHSVDSAPGTITQLREATSQLLKYAKEYGVTLLLVGHVTKGGDIAGPKTLEHMVDTVLRFEGEQISHYRILRGLKNRFGSTKEIGIFEMKRDGLHEVNNPTAFLDKHASDVPGKAIVGVMEGQRPMYYEIQALADQTFLAVPRRVVKGVNKNKILLILAVLSKKLNIQLGKYDMYVNVVGGVNINSPAADLGIAAAIISSVKNIPLAKKAIFTGELGLLGEIRAHPGEKQIVSEAKRLKLSPIYDSGLKSIRNMYQELKQ